MEWIDKINNVTNTPQEEKIWKILEENGLNPMLVPNCCEDILKIVIEREDGGCNYCDKVKLKCNLHTEY